jgi:hypothetical protein
MASPSALNTAYLLSFRQYENWTANCPNRPCELLWRKGTLQRSLMEQRLASLEGSKEAGT